MEVAFRRTGARRYAVIVSREGEPARVIDPAPGYDDDIPHDLVHYLVEAELGFTYGVFGSAARGGGTFTRTDGGDMATRARQRERRKQQKRERALRAHDLRHGAEMEKSERIAGVCDLAWRRKHGQRPDLGPARPRAASRGRRRCRTRGCPPRCDRSPVAGARGRRRARLRMARCHPVAPANSIGADLV